METLREITYDFHPEAEEEFLSAIDYYEESDVGLGRDFAREVYSAIHYPDLNYLNIYGRP